MPNENSLTNRQHKCLKGKINNKPLHKSPKHDFLLVQLCHENNTKNRFGQKYTSHSSLCSISDPMKSSNDSIRSTQQRVQCSRKHCAQRLTNGNTQHNKTRASNSSRSRTYIFSNYELGTLTIQPWMINMMNNQNPMEKKNHIADQITGYRK